jgi:uncharacterized damage-inducible protein DinB
MAIRIPRESSAELQFLLQLLDESYDRKSWHGPNLRGSLRGVTAEEAAWRPAAERHNIWEIALHAAYWKYAVLRRITGDKRGSFPLAGSNWFPRPDTDSLQEMDRNWKSDRALLGTMHRRLRTAAANLRPGSLRAVPAGGKVTCAAMLRGVALHDVYHAGQIQLLKKLRTSAVAPAPSIL